MAKNKRPVLPWFQFDTKKSLEVQQKKGKKIQGFTIRKKDPLHRPPVTVPDLYVKR